MEDDKLYLIYVNPIGTNMYGMYEYEFFFSHNIDVVWGEDWNEQCPSACGNLLPDTKYIDKVKRLTTIIPFFCAQENSCFSFQDCIDQIIAIAWLEDCSCVFYFGETFDDVIDILNKNNNINLIN